MRLGKHSFVLVAVALCVNFALPAKATSSANVASFDVYIRGGKRVTFEEAIRFSLVSLTGFLGNCSGVIIGERHVLTAAHCAATSTVQFGLEQGHPEASRSVVKSTKHPQYSAAPEDRHDLAVLTLNENVPAGFISARFRSENQKPLKPGEQVWALGYGDGGPSGILNEIALAVGGLSPAGTEFWVSQSAASGVCYGDSGGPVFVQDEADFQLVGITSRVKNQDCSGPAFFTYLVPHREWIQKIISEL